MSELETQPAAPRPRQISSELLRSLFKASKPDVPLSHFCATFLNSLTQALRASTACLWRLQGGKFQVLAHRGLDQIDLRPGTETWDAHQQLLAGVVTAGKRAWLRARKATRVGVNPLNLDLYCVPVTAANGSRFVIEVFVDEASGASASTSQRMTRLTLLCEFFQVYIQSQELRLRADQANAESAVRQFVIRLNAARSSRELAVVAVNEGRQVIGCERVSLGWFSGRQPKILSVSGHDSIDARSNVIRALCNLTRAANKSGIALKTSFPTTEPEETDPAQPEDPARKAYRLALNSYPADERPRHLLVIPLGDSSQRSGALIVEQFECAEFSNHTIQRAALVAEQIYPTLQRVELLESAPLLTWWSRPADRWYRRIWKPLLAVGVIGAVGTLAMIPMELRLPADGELLAESRHAVFAPENGIVNKVHVDHGSHVKKGDPLLTLSNLDLTAQHRELTGQLVQQRERQHSLEARRSGTRLSERDQIELQSNLVEAALAAEHTERQIKLLQQRLDRLQVVAPADGVISSWNVKQSLLNRTVLPGDALLQQINPEGDWQIEVRIPEDRVGYVSRRLSDLRSGETLKVDFVLATEPERRYSGSIRNIGERTELTGDGHIVRAVVDLDRGNLPPLRDGAEVRARLNCGPSRAGFVWLRELIEVIQTYWWY
jgi:multidrug efflux pump subunit AcrA (membrane-fusion protein)